MVAKPSAGPWGRPQGLTSTIATAWANGQREHSLAVPLRERDDPLLDNLTGFGSKLEQPTPL